MGKLYDNFMESWNAMDEKEKKEAFEELKGYNETDVKLVSDIYLREWQKELLGRLFVGNVGAEDYLGDDPRMQENPELQIPVVAKKTLFTMAYNDGYRWMQKREHEFCKNITLIDDTVNKIKETTPKEGNSDGTWQLGFCAGVMSYAIEWLGKTRTNK